MFLKPTYSVKGDISLLDIEQLYNDGIRGLIIDLDSTLMAPKSGNIDPVTEAWLVRARERFQMVVLTNNKREAYIENASLVLSMPVIGYAAKPWKAGFRKALDALQLPPAEVAVVGDRPLTDIWGGALSDMRTVLVRPLACIVEPSIKTFFRNLEHVFIKR
ncbi:YqeG family HAD IIIA-type phosphatase [Candidatus Obscuribacterales bacterium]|nr:YqeG family HAD IIIA-type phosphatase [Candidatus Obscuribacterales bacterium]MBX3152586.1 YqeG family HAD IIIA-type phosphatase [Candidatus Obscuribacterales bacterium]